MFLQVRKDKKNRIGEKYITNEGYEIEIIEYFSKKNCSIIFKCGYVKKNQYFSNVAKGAVKNPYHKSIFNIGYIGTGSYSVSKNLKHTKEYMCWFSMLQRCYNKKSQEKHPTYIGCYIVEEWHNFQNFAKWFEENYIENWHLDKDILVKGNKVYSPETCCFVPQEINSLFTKRKKDRGCYPIGGSKINNRYISQLRGYCIGSYPTPEEAFQSYKEAKEKYIKEIADKWKGLISDKVYEAMYNYQVEITD